jgi:hypothetical protein
MGCLRIFISSARRARFFAACSGVTGGGGNMTGFGLLPRFSRNSFGDGHLSQMRNSTRKACWMRGRSRCSAHDLSGHKASSHTPAVPTMASSGGVPCKRSASSFCKPVAISVRNHSSASTLEILQRRDAGERPGDGLRGQLLA